MTSMSNTPTYDPATQPKRPEASLGELVGEMTREVSDLFRKEVQLAKTEAREEISAAGKAGAMLGAAGLAGWMTLIMLSFAIVALVWLIVAAILGATGRRRLTSLRPLPQTTATLKEDVEWAKAQKS